MWLDKALILDIIDYCLTTSASEQTASPSQRELTSATLVGGHSKPRGGDATSSGYYAVFHSIPFAETKCSSCS